MNNKVYIVTGITGHLGTALQAKFRELNCEVRALIHERDIEVAPMIKKYYGDLRDKEVLSKMFEGLEDKEVVVIHGAAIISLEKKAGDIIYQVNVDGTKNIADLSLKHNVKKFIYISSVHAYYPGKKGTLITEDQEFDESKLYADYPKTKALASKYVIKLAKNEGLNGVTLHPSGIVGPYTKGGLNKVLADFLNGELDKVTSGGFDYVDVRDVVDAIFLAEENAKNGESYIISNKYFKTKDFINIMAEMKGKEKIKKVIPVSILKIFAPFIERKAKKNNEKAPFTTYSLYTITANSNFSYEKAKRELGYTPRDIKDTMEATYKYLIDNNMIKKS